MKIYVPLGLAAILLLAASMVKSQVPGGPTTWEYALVSYSPMTSRADGTRAIFTYKASICYASPQGCRSEEVAVTSDRPVDNNSAMMAAAAKLGEQGWELTAASESAFDGSGNHDQRYLYWRRRR